MVYSSFASDENKCALLTLALCVPPASTGPELGGTCPGLSHMTDNAIIQDSVQNKTTCRSVLSNPLSLCDISVFNALKIDPNLINCVCSLLFYTLEIN